VNPIESLHLFQGEIALLVGAFAILFCDFFIHNKKILGWLTLGVLIGAGFLTAVPHQSYGLFFGLFQLNDFMHFFRLAALGIVAITVLLSLSYQGLEDHLGEYYSLLLFMTFGLILMAASTNLLMIFISIEFVSILSYILVGFRKKDPRSKEAALKYLLFGSVASGMMLFGMSLLFGASGSLELAAIQQRLLLPDFLPVTIVATIFFLAGVGFKVSMAPFHLWAPDVYEGAPTPITAFLTVGPKALGFAILIRVLLMAYPALGNRWSAIISILAILTMTLGNVTAIVQSNIKRLLAYSSIAQAGYILMGIAAVSKIGVSAVLVYAVAYALTNLGAFTIVVLVSNHTGSDQLDAYTGLARRNPFVAASLTIFLLSLAGIPPLAGFIGKFYVFSAAIHAGFLTLAIAAALNSAIAAYYYFRIVRVMYLVPSTETTAMPQPLPLMLALCLMLIGTILLGIIPAPFIDFVQTSLFL